MTNKRSIIVKEKYLEPGWLTFTLEQRQRHSIGSVTSMLSGFTAASADRKEVGGAQVDSARVGMLRKDWVWCLT